MSSGTNRVGWLVLATFLVGLPASALAQSAQLGDPSDPPQAGEGAPTHEEVPPPPTHVADTDRAARLEAWLDVRASDDRRDALLGGAMGVTAGALLGGLGVWMWSDNLFGAAPFGRPMIGSLSLAMGGMMLGLGIVALAVPPLSVERLARFRAAAGEGMTAAALASFEGELRAEADAARQARWLSAAMGVGVALAGGTIAVLSASLDGLEELDRIYGGAVGGGYALFGVLLFAMSFIESPAETAWREYEAGRGPEQAHANVRFLAGLGSIGLAGEF